MTILHLNEHVNCRGGIETYLLGLFPLLAAQGVRSVVAFSAGDPPAGLESRRLPTLANNDRRARRAAYDEISALLRELRPQVAHVHNIHNTGAMAACLDAVPTVLTGHDYRYICPTSALFYQRSRRICERTCGPGCFTTTLVQHCLTPRPTYAVRYYQRVRWVMANQGRFSHVIVPSEYVAGRFERSGFARQRITCLPYFCPLAPRERPGEAPRTPTMLFLGRIHRSKGFECFIHALGLLPPHVRGLMVGDFSPDQQRQVILLAEKAGCAGRLALRGWATREQVPSLFEHATVTVVPSLWAETLCLVGLESLASGVPVVASDVGGIREWLIPEQTGLLTLPGDAHGVATQIARIVGDAALRQSMGAAGIGLIRERFSPDRHVARLIEIYRSSAGVAA